MRVRELAGGLRYGPLWARAAFRPFAEQVVTALTLRPGEIVVDLGDDDGTTAQLLHRRGLTVVGGTSELPALTAATGAALRVAAVVAVSGGMDDPPPPGAHWHGGEGVQPPRQSLFCSWIAAPHEDAVRSVFHLRPLVPASSAAQRWRDVVRFDTVDHLWAAALGRADVRRRAATMTAEELDGARALLGELLAAHLTADATLRIPAAMAAMAG